MKNLKGNDRKMTWNEAIAISKNGKLLFSAQVEGITGFAVEKFDATKYTAKYKEGIWVCSIWFFPQWNKTFFDLNAEEKKQAEISWERLGQLTKVFFINFFR